MVDGCATNWIPDILPTFKSWMKSKMDNFVLKRIQDKIDENQNKGKEVPQSFSPMKDLYVHYRITKMTWTRNESMMFEAMAAISTTVDGKNQTYRPKSGEVITNDFMPKDDRQSHLLQGLSISTEFLSG